jgi:hypothetical protein
MLSSPAATAIIRLKGPWTRSPARLPAAGLPGRRRPGESARWVGVIALLMPSLTVIAFVLLLAA